MNCSTSGLPVHHQLPEFTQTHLRWVSDAIQPPHPLLILVPFSSHLQFFPASGSFQVSQFFASGGPSIGTSASAASAVNYWIIHPCWFVNKVENFISPNAHEFFTDVRKSLQFQRIAMCFVHGEQGMIRKCRNSRSRMGGRSEVLVTMDVVHYGTG